MLAGFVPCLESLCGEGSARIVPNPDWLVPYLGEALVARGLARLQQDRHAIEMTAALFEDQRIVPLETHPSGWSALLLTINKEASTISTAAGAAVIHVLDAGGALRFHQCDVRGVRSFDDIPAGAVLGERTSFEVEIGQTFVIPQGMQAILFEGTSSRVKLLRFNGPVAAPLSLAFDPSTGRMMSASFSESEATAKHFFSILLGELTRRPAPDETPMIPSHEQEQLADLLDELGDGDVHAYTQWRIAQVMARLRPSSAVRRLQAMAGMGLPNLSRHANAALIKALGATA